MAADTKKGWNEKAREIDFLKMGEFQSNLPSPIDLNFRITKEVEFPRLEWTNANETPRLMKICNSGHSVVITAKWFGPIRPYITGGKLPGKYIFNQAHFHWGGHDQEGSEHQVEGVSLPLELHVMFFKTDYATPTNAMKELDGIVIVVYLFNLRKNGNTGLKPVIEALPKVLKPYTSEHIMLTPLSMLTPIFNEDYYMYWGSVLATKTEENYKIMWIVHRKAQPISADQLAHFRSLIGADGKPMVRTFRDTKSVNGRTVLYVNPGSMRDRTIIEAEPDPVEEPLMLIEETKEDHKVRKEKSRKSLSQRRKSAKRKSSVRRQSKKSEHKSQKSECDNYQHDNDRNILNVSVLETYCSNDSSQESSVTSVSSASEMVGGSSTSHCTKDIPNFCKLETHKPQDLITGNLEELFAGSHISPQCDNLLDQLQKSRKACRLTCMDILNQLERVVTENIENKIRKQSKGNARVEDNSDDSEKENTSEDQTITSVENTSMMQFHLPKVQKQRIKTMKCPAMQFAMVHTVPKPTQCPITKFTVEDTNCQAKSVMSPAPMSTRGHALVISSRIPLSLTDRIRLANRRRSGHWVAESLRREEKKRFLSNMLNNTMLTAVWKQVTDHSGILMNETLAMVASQTSNHNVAQQNMPYMQQNRLLEIEPNSRQRRFQGMKVEKLKRKRSDTLTTDSHTRKELTTVMKMFVNIGGNRKQNLPFRLRNPTKTKCKQQALNEKITYASQPQSLVKKPAWRY